MTPETAPALILVIEDENTLRQDIVEELQEAGYHTLAAKDGHAALEILNTAKPDLLLCDITMPGLDGYEVLKKLRLQYPDLSTTPFVFLTALSDPREVIEGKLLGADDYLVKPVDYDLMLATVAARLRQVSRIRTRHKDEISALRRTLSGLSGSGAKAALDLIAVGVILLDGHGKPVHLNRGAQEMISVADIIIGPNDTIRSPDPLSDRDLQRALSDTLAMARQGREKVAGVMLHVPQSLNTAPVMICSLIQSISASADTPHVALFLTAQDHRKPVNEPLLMDLFGLTQTEARVAAALSRNTRPADVALELGVSQTTISFHIRNLFQKTGTNRQADLIALIHAGPMMIQTG
ncbi:response regulator [Lentibacter sp. XHP0401]|uniref:response regulator n=1 Tax=Lentibacter sp. XHP0401 TaxID=2984334 RepID=UPI0021E85FB2|nr:response regulator [Lentibacter sp. XHP0401]MCV2892738.1 response regulator [Lentibacter sp. XHP0401]